MQMRQAIAEVRGLKPQGQGFGSLPDEEGWKLVRSRSTEKREGATIAEKIKEKGLKRKVEMAAERCFGCGQKGHYIANFHRVICFQCQEEGRRAANFLWIAKKSRMTVQGASRFPFNHLTNNKPNHNIYIIRKAIGRMGRVHDRKEWKQHRLVIEIRIRFDLI